MYPAKKALLIGATSALISLLPFSISVSNRAGVTISTDKAQAIIGRPLTPYSYAGARRRAIRRGYYGYYAHPYAYPYMRPGCVWVRGVRVCR